MLKSYITASLLSIGLVIGGCAADAQNGGLAGMGSNQTAGAVGGAALGAVAGAAMANNSSSKYKYKKHHVNHPVHGQQTYYTKHKNKHHRRDQALYAVGGALLGGLIGSSAGAQMDNRDRFLARDAARDSLDHGGSYHWRDPVDGMNGRSRIVGHPQHQGNCKTMKSDVFDRNGNKVGSEKRLYCRDPRGNWRAR